MRYFLFALLYMLIITPAAHAGPAIGTPEFDAGTLAGMGAAATGAYFAYQLWSAKRAAKKVK